MPKKSTGLEIALFDLEESLCTLRGRIGDASEAILGWVRRYDKYPTTEEEWESFLARLVEKWDEDVARVFQQSNSDAYECHRNLDDVARLLKHAASAATEAHTVVRRHVAAGGTDARAMPDPFDATARLPVPEWLQLTCSIDNKSQLAHGDARDALRWCWALTAPWADALEFTHTPDPALDAVLALADVLEFTHTQTMRRAPFNVDEFMRRAPVLVAALDVACELIRNADAVLAPSNARDGLRPWRDIGGDERLQLIVAAWLPYTQAGEAPPPDGETAQLLADRFGVCVDRSVIGKYRRSNTTLAEIEANMARAGIDPKEKFPTENKSAH